jgi:hypothetical protein
MGSGTNVAKHFMEIRGLGNYRCRKNVWYQGNQISEKA